MAKSVVEQLNKSGFRATRLPAGAATRFVMAGEDLGRNVKDTAGKIAQSVAKQV